MAEKKEKKPKTGKQNKKPNPGVTAILKTALIFFVAISVIFIAARTIGGITLTSLAGDIKVFFQSLGFGEGYPYKTTGESPEQIFCDGNRVFVFSRDKTVLLSSSAKKIAEIPIEYGNPAIKYRDGKALIYDRDSAKLRIQSTSEIISEKETDGTILTAALGRKGNYAAAYQNKGTANELKVYSKNGKEAFKWSFPGEKVTDIDLSDDGKYAVVSTIFSKNAQTSSRVYVFRFDSKDYVSCFDYEDCAVVSVRYSGSHNIAVISSKGRGWIKDNSTMGDTAEFGSDILFKYSTDGGKYSAVALKKYGGDNFGTVKIFRGGRLVSSVTVDKEIKDVYCTKKYTAVLTTSSVMILKNGSGKLKTEVSAELSVSEAAINGKVYMMSPSEILREKF